MNQSADDVEDQEQAQIPSPPRYCQGRSLLSAINIIPVGSTGAGATLCAETGDVHFYDVGVVHSPNRQGRTKLVRIEGANLDHIKRSSIKAV